MLVTYHSLRVSPPLPVKNSGCTPAPQEEQCHQLMQYSETPLVGTAEFDLPTFILRGLCPLI